MDARRRRLERAAQAGEREAQVGLLRVELQAGEWTRELVSLAATLGDEIAQEALGLPAQATPSLDAWLEGLLELGKEALVWVALAALPPLRRGEELPADEARPAAAIEAAEAWLLRQDEASRVAARQAAEDCQRCEEDLSAALLEDLLSMDDVLFAVGAYTHAAACAGSLRPLDALESARQAIRGSAGLFPGREGLLPEAEEDQRAWLGGRVLDRLGFRVEWR